MAWSAGSANAAASWPSRGSSPSVPSVSRRASDCHVGRRWSIVWPVPPSSNRASRAATGWAWRANSSEASGVGHRGHRLAMGDHDRSSLELVHGLGRRAPRGQRDDRDDRRVAGGAQRRPRSHRVAEQAHGDAIPVRDAVERPLDVGDRVSVVVSHEPVSELCRRQSQPPAGAGQIEQEREHPQGRRAQVRVVGPALRLAAVRDDHCRARRAAWAHGEEGGCVWALHGWVDATGRPGRAGSGLHMHVVRTGSPAGSRYADSRGNLARSCRVGAWFWAPF